MAEGIPQTTSETIETAEDIALRERLSDFVDRKDVPGLERFVKVGWYYDELTGIRNLRGFEHDSEVMLKGIARVEPGRERRLEQDHDTDFAFLMLDIDHFKAVNDTYGHAAGDAALKLVASELTRILREQDIVGRVGGEEFGVFMKGQKENDRFMVAEKIRHAIEDLVFVYEGKEIKLTMSIGIAKYVPGEKFSDTKKRADGALYRAKNSGRNRVAISSE